MSNIASQRGSTKSDADPLRMPSGDARKFRRFEVDLNGYAALVPYTNPDDHAWELYRSDADLIRITNLSASGLHFLSSVEFSSADVVWVSVMFDRQLTTVRARVVHCRPVPSGVTEPDVEPEEFVTGVQFVKSAFAQKAIGEILDYLMSISGDGMRDE